MKGISTTGQTISSSKRCTHKCAGYDVQPSNIESMVVELIYYGIWSWEHASRCPFMTIGQNSFLIEIARKRETKCNYCEDRQVERDRQTERKRQIEREKDILLGFTHMSGNIKPSWREREKDIEAG